MPDYAQKMADHKNTSLSVEDQKRMGQAAAGDMDEEHKSFLATVLKMVDAKAIDVYKPESFLKMDVYQTLNDEWRAKTDLALVNIATQLQNIYLFRTSKHTPDEAPILQHMIEELWQMKQRIEVKVDVFKF